MKFSRISCVIFLALGLSNSAFATPLQCNVQAHANVVFMLDESGSSAGIVATERSAVRTFLTRASAPSSSLRPNLAVASFNTACPNFYEPCDVGPSQHARIVAPLSVNGDYTQVVNAVTEGGPIQSVPDTGTSLDEALKVANDYIVGFGNHSYPNFVILFSDGDPNFPGFYNDPAHCDNFYCTPAETAASNRAALLRAGNTRVYTIHLGVTQYGGVEFLANHIAYNTSYAYAANASNIDAIMQQIFEQISCDDGRNCTADYCGSNNQCQYTEISTPCLVTPTPVATPTHTPTPVPTRTVTPGPTPTAITVPTVVVTGCTSQSIAPNISALEELTDSQGSQLTRIYRDVNVRVSHCPSQKRARDYVTRAKRALKSQYYPSNVRSVDKLPSSVQSCAAGVSCTNAALGFSTSSYVNNSDRLRKLIIEGADLVLKCKNNGGTCEGSGCADRAQYRIAQHAADVSRANKVHKSNVSNAKGLPAQKVTCH